VRVESPNKPNTTTLSYDYGASERASERVRYSHDEWRKRLRPHSFGIAGDGVPSSSVVLHDRRRTSTSIARRKEDEESHHRRERRQRTNKRSEAKTKRGV